MYRLQDFVEYMDDGCHRLCTYHGRVESILVAPVQSQKGFGLGLGLGLADFEQPWLTWFSCQCLTRRERTALALTQFFETEP